jgi:hypothetical protein
MGKALGLAIRETAHLASAAALALLAVFTAAAGVLLWRGRRPDCACFGAIRPQPVGGRTIIRNAALAAVCIALLLFPAGREFPHLGHAPSWLAAAGIAGTAALILVLLVMAWRLHRRLQAGAAAGQRSVPGGLTQPRPAGPLRAGLPIGAPAPRFDLPALDSGTVSLDALRAGARPALLVFASPACTQCSALMTALAAILDRGEPGPGVAVVVSGDREAARRLVGSCPVPAVAIDDQTAAGARAVARLLDRQLPAAAPR